jgi:hypothetical protein
LDIHQLHESIEDSMARQAAWGTDNFIGSRDGTDFRGMSENELAQYFEDEATEKMAEQLGQGITRQGGNY